MKITPLDIQQQKFATTWRGWDRGEVDAFLNLVAAEFEALVRDGHNLREELRRSEKLLEQYREREQALKETMITAQKLTEDMRHSARKDAELVVGQAQLDAERILQGAQQRYVAMVDEIHELKRQRAVLTENLRSMLSAHQKLLEVHSENEREKELEDKLKLLPRKPARPAAEGDVPLADAVGARR